MDKLINTNLITEYITANRLTQKEFCKQCKIGLSQLYRIMRGENVMLTAVWKISKYMGVDLCQLFA
ncbi:MAG: helix-turn-helix domain-containing protein [Clostridiales bacterium]|nr:helix-turn-helix domain-containing protein [Clostridiales bacterium]